MPERVHVFSPNQPSAVDPSSLKKEMNHLRVRDRRDNVGGVLSSDGVVSGFPDTVTSASR